MAQFVFDLNELTIGDIEDLEGASGVPFEDMDFSKPSMKLLKAMIYVVARKGNPDFTLGDVRNMKVSELQSLEIVPERNPT